MPRTRAIIKKYWPLLAMAAICSCRKFVDVSPPASQLTTDMIFSSDQTATAAMAGLYSKAMSAEASLLNGGMSCYPALSADELYRTTPYSPIDAFTGNVLNSSNTDVSILYASAYTTIYNANMMLENLPGAAGISDSTKHQLMGESKFMRAMVYFYLVNLFGPVPLETTTSYVMNARAGRAALDTLYQQIINDLADAQTLLPVAYATGHAGAGARTRANKWAAAALLARVYLYRQRWPESEAAATTVINSGLYTLVAPDSVYRATSHEAIWQLQPVSTIMNTAEGNMFVPVTDPQSMPVYAFTSWLDQAFEPGDLRRTHWTGTRTIAGASYTYPYKYKIRTGEPPYNEDNMVLRLAELYLIRAEARAYQGEGADAVADLNIIRARAGLAGLSASLLQPQVLAAVMQERRIELFAEWGHRWFDLKRTGQVGNILGTEKKGWVSTAVVYPIPYIEIQRNPSLTQNANY